MVCVMQRSPESVAPGGPQEARPPVLTQPPSGATVPGTGARRQIRPQVWPAPTHWPAFAVEDPYVRRFWVPVLGPGAIADLLRLATAAARDRSLPLPRHLSTLARAGMVAMGTDGALAVRTLIPAVPPPLQSRLPRHLRREHMVFLGGLAEDGGPAART